MNTLTTQDRVKKEKEMDTAIDVSQEFYWNVYNDNRTEENLNKYKELCKVWSDLSKLLFPKL